jgi:hypothetical protein
MATIWGATSTCQMSHDLGLGALLYLIAVMGLKAIRTHQPMQFTLHQQQINE